MDIHHAIQRLVDRDARLSETAASIDALLKSTVDLSVEPFFEPVSLVVVEKNTPRLLEVRAHDLASWVRHIAASTFCRMRALEAPVLENLIAARTLAAMALLRSHFEAAAMAAYCLERLTKAARREDLTALADLIPKTLFGTGLKKFREKHTTGELLSTVEGDTIRICQAVEALDPFYYHEMAKGDLAVVYSSCATSPTRIFAARAASCGPLSGMTVGRFPTSGMSRLIRRWFFMRPRHY